MSGAPRRIQRQRTRGWRAPEGAVYVGRPSRWGNPYRPGADDPIREPWVMPMSWRRVVDLYEMALTADPRPAHVLQLPFTVADLREHLAGRDLACYCRLDLPCHADVLLELANGASS